MRHLFVVSCTYTAAAAAAYIQTPLFYMQKLYKEVLRVVFLILEISSV